VWSSLLIVVYSALIVAASLAGGSLPSLVKLTHARMQFAVSLVAGLMLGVSLFHMLPHAAADTQSLDQTIHWLMAGLLGMFFLIRIFHFHHHDTAEELESTNAADPPTHDHDSAHDHDHDAPAAHHHDHDQGHPHGSPARHKLSWVGVAFGLAIHTLIDGVALASSVQADALETADKAFLGGGTFLAILLHKPLDALSITALMAAGGWTPRARALVNAGFALMCPLGAILFDAGVAHFAAAQHMLIGCALAFSAGVFLCISLGDLLPEVQFHSHDRFKLSFALLLGVALAYGIRFLEPAHRHAHVPAVTPTDAIGGRDVN
jgi:zinc and cadmium transporter